MADAKTIEQVQAHLATLQMKPCSGCDDVVHDENARGRAGVWAFIDLFTAYAVPTAYLLADSRRPPPPKAMTVARIVCMHCGFIRDFAWPPKPRELLGRAVKGEQL